MLICRYATFNADRSLSALNSHSLCAICMREFCRTETEIRVFLPKNKTANSAKHRNIIIIIIIHMAD